MVDYLRNTLFVEDLIEFLFNLENISWKAKIGVHSFKHELRNSPFHPDIGYAVDNLVEVFYEQLQESYTKLIKEGIRDKATYSKYALQEASNCFSQGYTHECFLGFCVQVLGVPGIHYDPSLPDVLDVLDSLDAAAQVVVLVLFSHQMTGEFYRQGGWGSLAEVSRKLNDRITYDECHK